MSDRPRYEAYTVTIVIHNDNLEHDLPTTESLINGILSGLPDDWYSPYMGDEYHIHSTSVGSDVQCDKCIVIVDLDEYVPIPGYEGVFCQAHRNEVIDEIAAEGRRVARDGGT